MFKSNEGLWNVLETFLDLSLKSDFSKSNFFFCFQEASEKSKQLKSLFSLSLLL